MEQLTKEQICDKIAKLKNELATCEDLLNKIDAGEQAESEFSIKAMSMVGGYYIEDFGEENKYYHRINRAVLGSDIDGNYAKLECATVFNSDPADCYMQLQSRYFYERDIDGLKPISKEEFDAAAAKFNEIFNSPT